MEKLFSWYGGFDGRKIGLMTELEALKIALGLLVTIGAGLVVGGFYIGKMVRRAADHSGEIHTLSVMSIRTVDCLNRIASKLGIEGVGIESERRI